MGQLVRNGIECDCLPFQSTIPRIPNTEGLTSLCEVLNYTQRLLQVNSTEPATAVTALVAEQVHRDACQWVCCTDYCFILHVNDLQHSTMH